MEKLLKAKKGTPEYEEWLRKYREKRGKKAQDPEAGGKAKSVLEKKETDSKAKNGAVETHYGNGQLESRANYKDGKLDGIQEFWNENGQQLSRTNYKNGKRDGLREAWHDNGQLAVKVNYKKWMKARNKFCIC